MTRSEQPVSALGPTQPPVGPTDDDPRALIGQVIADRYEVEALLGVGGMGSVYRARHVKIHKLVALKTLHAEMLSSPDAVARFEREAIAAARIDHPNVVVATDFGPLPDGRYYLVLEYVEGHELSQVLAETGPLSVTHALAITRQISSALEAAHTLGIVHRDLKPDNIMLVQRGVDELVKVLDFGIAKITLDDNAQQLTQFGAVFGTPQYMSPEQAKGLTVDGRSDLYSLGVVLYEMLKGALPFEAKDPLGYLMQHLTAQPAPLPESIAEPVRSLVGRLLEKDPSRRPPNAANLLAELDEISYRLATGSTDGTASAALPTPVLRLPRTLGTRSVALAKHLLARPIRICGRTFSTVSWLLLALLPASGLIVAGYYFRPHKTTSTLTSPTVTAPEQHSALPTMSREAFEREVNRINAIKVYERTELDWMILARGTAKLERWEQSALAYQALLSLRADLRRDPGLLSDLLNATQDPKSFRVVLNLAETVLGRHGIDLIWEMWQSDRLDPDRKEQTEKLAKKLLILSRRASPALRVAIELSFTTKCEKLLSVLERAATDADSRSSERLATLASRIGCGPTDGVECFPCLNGNTLLETATARAKTTPAPRLGETKED
jgi:serine/threonine-protein kinase